MPAWSSPPVGRGAWRFLGNAWMSNLCAAGQRGHGGQKRSRSSPCGHAYAVSGGERPDGAADGSLRSAACAQDGGREALTMTAGETTPARGAAAFAEQAVRCGTVLLAVSGDRDEEWSKRVERTAALRSLPVRCTGHGQPRVSTRSRVEYQQHPLDEYDGRAVPAYAEDFDLSAGDDDADAEVTSERRFEAVADEPEEESEEEAAREPGGCVQSGREVQHGQRLRSKFPAEGGPGGSREQQQHEAAQGQRAGYRRRRCKAYMARAGQYQRERERQQQRVSLEGSRTRQPSTAPA